MATTLIAVYIFYLANSEGYSAKGQEAIRKCPTVSRMEHLGHIYRHYIYMETQAITQQPCHDVKSVMLRVQSRKLLILITTNTFCVICLFGKHMILAF